MPRSFARNAFLLLIAVCCSGCASPYIRWPRLFDPGDIRTQRYEAAIWDPYPDSSIGPAVIGARPREYMQQIPQAQRSQIWSDWWGPRPAP